MTFGVLLLMLQLTAAGALLTSITGCGTTVSKPDRAQKRSYKAGR